MEEVGDSIHRIIVVVVVVIVCEIDLVLTSYRDSEVRESRVLQTRDWRDTGSFGVSFRAVS